MSRGNRAAIMAQNTVVNDRQHARQPAPEIPEKLIFCPSSGLPFLPLELFVFPSLSTFLVSGVLPHKHHRFPTKRERERER